MIGLRLVGSRTTVIELACEFATMRSGVPLPFKSADVTKSGWSPAVNVFVAAPNEKPGFNPVLESCVGLSITSAGVPLAVTIEVSACEAPLSVAFTGLFGMFATWKVIVSSVPVMSAVALIVYETDVCPGAIVATNVGEAAVNVTRPLGPVSV